MRSLFTRALGIGIVLLFVQPASAQFGPPPNRGGGPGIGVGGAPQPGLGGPVLKTRELQDKPLAEKDQRKYDALIANMQKSKPKTPTAELSGAFRLASLQLKNGQEKTARESFDKAWQLAAQLYHEPKTMGVATGQIRTHLRELQTLASKDPELAVTLLTELGPVQRQALEAIEQTRGRTQLTQPMATMWYQFMQGARLDKEPLEQATYWIVLFPQIALADRPLTPEQQNEYQSQLTAITVNITPLLRQLAERQLGRPVRPLQPNNPEASDTVDPATAQVISMLDLKRGPLTRFLEADVHFRFGQLRDGLIATQSGWRELLEFYRANRGGVSPIDAETHFEAVERMAAENPVQALAVLDQVDPAYRTMTQIDRFFGLRVADLWARMASSLPLNPEMLMKTAFWLEYVAKQHKDAGTKYAATMELVKHNLEQAGIKVNRHDDDDDGEDDDGKGNEDDDHDDGKGEGRERQGVGGRRGLNVPRTIDTLRKQQ